MSAQLDKINAQISALETSLTELKAQRQSIIDAEAELAYKAQAKDNALNAIFDGLKFVADLNNPIPLTFPMEVYPNMYYGYNDGIKVITYLAIKTNDPVIVNADNYLDYLEPYVG